MKGKFTWLIAVLLCLMAYAPAQGAIVWDHPSLLHPGQTTTLKENYPILSNGGSFGYFPGAPLYYNPSNDAPPGTIGTSTITENFYNGSGQMTLNASSQGAVVGDGFEARVQTGITFNDAGGPADHFNANGNAADVHQSVSATLSRQFVNDGGNIMADLTAQMAGLVNINLDNADYEISANIDLLEFGPGVAGANVYHLEMDNDPASWDQVMENVLIRSMSDHFYYMLNCGLNVDVQAKNLVIGPAGFQGLELNGPFQIGDQGPLILTAGLTDVQPVPVPASLFLLLAGISGLTAWRYLGRKVQ